MQKMNLRNIQTIKKLKIRKLEGELSKEFKGMVNGERFICPFCKYQSRKNRKGSAILFKNEDGSNSMKCFSCGRWRKL